MGLSQSDVVKFLLKSPAQHEAYQILAAYVYSKSSHGNLPAETLSKLLSIQRKLSSASGINFTPASPLGRAFEAVRTQLLAVNRQYLIKGPSAFGSLGQIGAASSPDAITAWTKATDGKIKSFDDGTTTGVAIDAGRVAGVNRAGLSISELPPPMYQAPPTAESANRLEEGTVNEAIEASLDPTSQEKTREELELEQGRSTLARLRLEMVVKQKAMEEEEARVKGEEDASRLVQEGGEGVIEGETVHEVPTEAPPSFDTVEPNSTTPINREVV